MLSAYEDIGGCYPLWPYTLLDFHKFSDDTQPHSIIVCYIIFLA